MPDLWAGFLDSGVSSVQPATGESAMKKIILSAACFLLAASAASGQASRTWVSGVGDDANPCSRTAPCKTFAGAISKTAAKGEISVLDPGGYGAVTITKSITINGTGQLAGILAAGTNGIIINALATDTVVIKNISIEGFGTGINGIRLLAGGFLHVQGVEISGFAQKGISIESSTATQVFIQDSFIRNNKTVNGGGIVIAPGATGSVTGTIDNVRAEQNLFGIKVQDRSNITARNCDFSNNENNGAIATSVSAAAVLNLEDTVLSTNRNAGLNSSGVQSFGANSILRISNCDIFNNDIGINAASGGSVVSFGNNRVTQNTTPGAPTVTIGEI
jgi:parallel beta-helix repeat protein